MGNWFNPGTGGGGHRQGTGSSSGAGRPVQDSSDTGQTCFVIEHDYHPSAAGDHMIRVVSPQNVFAEAVGVPGAKLQIRRPEAATTQGSGTDANQPQGAQGDVFRSGSGQGQDTSNPAATEQGNVQGPGHDQTGSGDGLHSDQAADGAAGGSELSDDPSAPLKVRPQDRIGLRAVVVFPGGETDDGDPIHEDERDVTSQAEFSSSAPDVVSVNTTDGTGRGEIRAKTEGSATIVARYSGLRAQRKVSVAGQHATALHIQAATGETTVKKGGTLPLQATVTYDSGKSEQVTDRVTWRSSDESVASVDSHGVVEGHAVGTAKITGTYKSKDGKSMTDAVEPQVTPDNTGAEGQAQGTANQGQQEDTTGQEQNQSEGASQGTSGESGSEDEGVEQSGSDTAGQSEQQGQSEQGASQSTGDDSASGEQNDPSASGESSEEGTGNTENEGQAAA